MSDLVLEPQTQTRLEGFISQPAHALLLVAPDGAGKSAMAQMVAAALLATTPDALEKHPYMLRLSPNKGTLSIDDIRQLQHALQLKTLGSSHNIRRVVIIEDAENLTIEAQNALLKSLEEPPSDTAIILTTSKLTALLPTITSRAQQIRLRPPSLVSLRRHFSDFPSATIEQAYNLSGGLPGLMTALLQAEETHPLVSSVETAKHWLRATTFERLLLIDELSKQKSTLGPLLIGLQRVSQAALVQAARKQQLSSVIRWQRILTIATKTHDDYLLNAQPKLLMTKLMLEL